MPAVFAGTFLSSLPGEDSFAPTFNTASSFGFSCIGKLSKSLPSRSFPGPAVTNFRISWLLSTKPLESSSLQALLRSDAGVLLLGLIFKFRCDSRQKLLALVETLTQPLLSLPCPITHFTLERPKQFNQT